MERFSKKVSGEHLIISPRMKTALFASVLAAESLPAQAQLSNHELVAAKFLAALLVYEKHCGPLGPKSQWEQKRLSENPSSLSNAEISEIVRDALATWKEDSQTSVTFFVTRWPIEMSNPSVA